MTDKTGREPPSAERVATMAALVAREMHTQTTRKKHGGHQIYDDGKLVISLDTFTPNINVSIIREEQPIRVFSAGYRNWDRPWVFHPGGWIDHLEKLSERAQNAAAERKETERRRSQLEHEARFTPVDDSDLFPQEKDGS